MDSLFTFLQSLQAFQLIVHAAVVATLVALLACLLRPRSSGQDLSGLNANVVSCEHRDSIGDQGRPSAERDAVANQARHLTWY